MNPNVFEPPIMIAEERKKSRITYLEMANVLHSFGILNLKLEMRHCEKKYQRMGEQRPISKEVNVPFEVHQSHHGNIASINNKLTE